jgi:hypothetical protein
MNFTLAQMGRQSRAIFPQATSVLWPCLKPAAAPKCPRGLFAKLAAFSREGQTALHARRPIRRRIPRKFIAPRDITQKTWGAAEVRAAPTESLSILKAEKPEI